jgi:hypothetical protein
MLRDEAASFYVSGCIKMASSSSATLIQAPVNSNTVHIIDSKKEYIYLDNGTACDFIGREERFIIITKYLTTIIAGYNNITQFFHCYQSGECTYNKIHDDMSVIPQMHSGNSSATPLPSNDKQEKGGGR